MFRRSEKLFKIRRFYVGICYAEDRFRHNKSEESKTIEYEGVASIILYDMLGREVLRQNINGNTEIAIDQAPKGVYCMNVVAEGKVIGNKKIVKQ